MPLTRDEVYWLYRCILGRPPETEAAHHFHTIMQPNFDMARAVFMQSREFQDAMLPPVTYRSRPWNQSSFEKPAGLAIAAIVKNEARNIATMLHSCLPIASHVVIADTGSSDETKAIAREVLRISGVPYTLADIPFIDFSQARNGALALVPAEMSWVLMLDADEHLVPEDFPLFADLLRADVDAWGLPRYNFTDADKAKPVQSYPDHLRRLLRNRIDNPVRYSGPVHEDVIPPFRTAKAPADTTRFDGTHGGPHIHHMGGLDGKEEEAGASSRFYAELAARRP